MKDKIQDGKNGYCLNNQVHSCSCSVWTEDIRSETGQAEITGMSLSLKQTERLLKHVSVTRRWPVCALTTTTVYILCWEDESWGITSRSATDDSEVKMKHCDVSATSTIMTNIRSKTCYFPDHSNQYTQSIRAVEIWNNPTYTLCCFPSSGLVCNRTFDNYACWPDGLPNTTVSVSCPWYLPWHNEGKRHVGGFVDAE